MSVRSGSDRFRLPIPLRVVAFAAMLGAAASSAAALTVEQIESRQGIKAWLVEERSVPLVALRFAFAGGSVQDRKDKEGGTSMVSALLMEGAGNLTAAAFKERLSALGARLSASSGRDAVYGGLETLTDRLKPSADLLRDMLTAPRFAPADVERVKAQRLTDLALAANNPTLIAFEHWYAQAFAGHPYGASIDGTPESIKRLTAEDLQDLHRRMFARDVLRVVVVGDIDKRGAIELLDAVFGALPARAQLEPVARTVTATGDRPVVVNKELPLATAVFGLASLPVDHPDYAALKVLNQIIGSGDFDSTLMDEIRVKRGLAYSIQTSLNQDTLASFMLGTFATKNENMSAALDVVRDVLARTARDGPAQAPFENAKRFLVGSFLLDFDTSANVASSLLRIWLDGEGPEALKARRDKINGVTIEDVRRVAREVLKADQLIVTVVGKPNLP